MLQRASGWLGVATVFDWWASVLGTAPWLVDSESLVIVDITAVVAAVIVVVVIVAFAGSFLDRREGGMEVDIDRVASATPW